MSTAIRSLVETSDLVAGGVDGFVHSGPGLMEHRVTSEPPLASYTNG